MTVAAARACAEYAGTMQALVQGLRKRKRLARNVPLCVRTRLWLLAGRRPPTGYVALLRRSRRGYRFWKVRHPASPPAVEVIVKRMALERLHSGHFSACAGQAIFDASTPTRARAPHASFCTHSCTVLFCL